MRAVYFMDDFFSLDFPFDNFSLQFMDGGIWIFDTAQSARVPQDAFKRCAASVCVPELRHNVALKGSSPAELIGELQDIARNSQLQLVVATEDPKTLDQLRQHGIESRSKLRIFQAEMVDKMMGADILFASMNANGALLEDLIADALSHTPCTDIAGETVKVRQVYHLSIDFSAGEEEGFAIYPDRVELCKHFDVLADYEKPNGTVVAQGPLRVKVSAIYRMEGEHGYFTINKIEG